MKLTKTICLLASSLIILVACSTNKRHYGNYFNRARYWGPMFTLNADSTFAYVCRTNIGEMVIQQETAEGMATVKSDNYIFEDSSYGRYSLRGDTLLLQYHTEEIMGPYNGFNIRTKRLLWKRRKLYYFFGQTDEPVMQKEYYMRWNKYRVANLSRDDQRYRAPSN
jgi:hypothetical protein